MQTAIKNIGKARRKRSTAENKTSKIRLTGRYETDLRKETFPLPAGNFPRPAKKENVFSMRNGNHSLLISLNSRFFVPFLISPDHRNRDLCGKNRPTALVFRKKEGLSTVDDFGVHEDCSVIAARISRIVYPFRIKVATMRLREEASESASLYLCWTKVLQSCTKSTSSR